LDPVMSLGLLTGYFIYPYNREKNEKKQSQAKKNYSQTKTTPRALSRRGAERSLGGVVQLFCT
jgi:hypothetical protein